MKPEKGLIHLLIAGEIVVLVLILILGILKQVKEPKEEAQTEYTVSIQENWLDTEQTETNPATETETMPEAMDTFSEEVEAMLEEMTIEEKVAQLFFVTPEALTGTDRVTLAGNATRAALSQYPVGGICYGNQNFQGSEQFKNLVTRAEEMSHEQHSRYFFAGATVELEGQMQLAIAKNGEAEKLITLVQGNETANAEELEGLIQIPLIQQPEDIRETKDLACVLLTGTEIDAVLAMQEGADMLCVTAEFETAYEALLHAVEENQVTMLQLNQAVGHILEKKQEVSQ